MLKRLICASFAFFLAIIHCSLLLCVDPNHCIIPLDRSSFSPNFAWLLHIVITYCDPITLQTIQAIAQLIVLTEIACLCLFIFSLMQKVINFMCEIAFLIITLIAIYRAYLFWHENLAVQALLCQWTPLNPSENKV